MRRGRKQSYSRLTEVAQVASGKGRGVPRGDGCGVTDAGWWWLDPPGSFDEGAMEQLLPVSAARAKAREPEQATGRFALKVGLCRTRRETGRIERRKMLRVSCKGPRGGGSNNKLRL